MAAAVAPPRKMVRCQGIDRTRKRRGLAPIGRLAGLGRALGETISRKIGPHRVLALIHSERHHEPTLGMARSVAVIPHGSMEPL